MTELATNVLPVQSVSPASLGAGAFRYIDIASIDREQKTIINPALVDNQDAPSRARQLVRANDVLVSTVRPNLNAVAYVPRELDGAVASTGFTVLRPDSRKLDSRYLYHWVRTQRFVDEMTRLATGASYPAVSDSIVKRNEIPLPPVKEQVRIAEVLDRADALRQKRRLAIQKVDALLRSVFLDMFGDPVSNPKGWRTSSLESFGEFIGGGTPRRDVPSFYTGSICWATSKDMKGRFLTDTQEHITEEAIRKSATKLVPQETILLVVKSKILMRYLPVLVAKVPTCFGQDLKGLVLHDKSLVPFISHSIIFGQRSLLQQARGINTEGLTLDHLRPFQIMLPPDELVSAFTRIASKVTDCIGRFEGQQDSSNSLFATIQHRAFKGELF